MVKDKWTQKWPKKAGLYWFYGYRYGRISVGQACTPEHCLVKVRKVSNGVMYVENGTFMSESECEEAWFIKATVPTPPMDFTL